MVVAPVRPGRVVAIAPAIRDPRRLARVAEGTDLLIADACTGARALAPRRPPAAAAGEGGGEGGGAGGAAAGEGGGGGGGGEEAASGKHALTVLEEGASEVAKVAGAAGVPHLLLTGFHAK
jgi:hypothetical protein